MHHFATLIGYGASAVNPYLMLETLDELVAEGRVARVGADGTPVPISAEEAAQNVVKAIGKGLLKTISKMGISTIQSYRGAQIFEAVGLEQGPDRHALHGHRLAHRRSRPGGAGHRGARAPRPRLPRTPRSAAARGRRVRLAARRRAPHVEPRDDRARPARGAGGQRRRGRRPERRPRGVRGGPRERRIREVPRVRARGQRRRRAQGHAARPAARSARTCGNPAHSGGRRIPSRRSSRRARSSSASAPGR